MSNKHFKVTFYDGKGQRLVFVEGKSLNEARTAAAEVLRQQRLAGASITAVEKMAARDVPKGDGTIYNKATYDDVVRYCEQEHKAYYSKSNPIKDPKQIIRMIRARR